MKVNSIKDKLIYTILFFCLSNFAFIQNSDASANNYNIAPEPSPDHDPYNQETLLQVTKAFIRHIGSDNAERAKIYNIIADKHSKNNYNTWVNDTSDHRESMSYADNHLPVGTKIFSIMSFPDQYGVIFDLKSFKDKGTIEISTTTNPMEGLKTFYNDRATAKEKAKVAKNVRIVLRLPEDSLHYISTNGLSEWKKANKVNGAEIVSIHFIP